MKIPEYSRQVKDAPLPGSRFSGGATAASFNGEAANIAKLGKAVDNVSLVLAKEALKKDKINATSSYNQARTDTDALLRGEGGIYNRKGLDAENSYGEFLKASEEINKKYSKDLKGQRAKGLFAANYADYITTNGKAVMTHESKERDAAQTIMRDADNKISMDAMVNDWTNPDIVQSNENRIKANMIAQWGPYGVAEAKIAEAMSLAYGKMADRIGVSSPAGALEFFKLNKDKFLATERTAKQEELTKKSEEDWSRVKAIELAGQPLDAQLAEIDKIKGKETKQLDDLRKRVKTRAKEKEMAEQAVLKQDFEKTADDIMKDPKTDIPLRFDLAKTNQLYSLKTLMKKEQLAEQGVGAPTVNDDNKYYELQTEAIYNPDDFADKDIIPEIMTLDKTHRDKIMQLQVDVRKGQMSNELISKTKYVDDLIGSTPGLDKIDGTDEFKQSNAIRRYFDQVLSTYPEEKQGLQETWDKVTDYIYLKQKIDWGRDIPLWKALYKGNDITEPAEKLPGVPKDSVWTVYAIKGKEHKGWVKNKDGRDIFYNVLGGRYFVKGGSK